MNEKKLYPFEPNSEESALKELRKVAQEAVEIIQAKHVCTYTELLSNLGTATEMVKRKLMLARPIKKY